MKKILSAFIALLFAAACYMPTGNSQGMSDAGDGATEAGLTQRYCGTRDAMYTVTFTKISGDCPEVNDPAHVWVNVDGTIHFPPNCMDRSRYDACTTYMNEDCKTWVYDEWMTGELNWFPGGSGAEGRLTFTAYVMENGALFCSSVYDTKYTLLWQAVN